MYNQGRQSDAHIGDTILLNLVGTPLSNIHTHTSTRYLSICFRHSPSTLMRLLVSPCSTHPSSPQASSPSRIPTWNPAKVITTLKLHTHANVKGHTEVTHTKLNITEFVLYMVGSGLVYNTRTINLNYIVRLFFSSSWTSRPSKNFVKTYSGKIIFKCYYIKIRNTVICEILKFIKV